MKSKEKSLAIVLNGRRCEDIKKWRYKKMENIKIKENAWLDFSKIIEKSWTFNRMTKEEKETWDHIIRSEQAKNSIKGNYQQRMEALNFVYSAFLAGLGYNGFNWREKEDTPKF